MAAPSGPAVAGVDVGGTFTDAVVVGADGRPVMRKAATTPDDQSAGLAGALDDARGDIDVSALGHGTTTATNAVLERDLGRAALVVTEGFRDLLVIARQDRPSLYDLTAVRPEPVVPPERVVTAVERVAADGTVLVPLTDDEVDRVVDRIRDLEADAVAVVLLFSWTRPDHERQIGEAIARALPSVHVTLSCDLVGAVREYERASTCALNAAVGPLMSGYLSRVADRVGGAAVTVMTSGGGTAGIERMVAEPVHTLLSGPAAGVVAAAAAATSAGHPDAVAFDMGGTSTDVCLILEGRPVIDQRGRIGDLPIGTPTVGIHTVGAGGGSIASLDPGGALQVGPRSAGAVPGPACYGRGGTRPTVTDAHAVLGHLVDLAGGQLEPDLAAAEAAVAAVEGATARGIIDVVRAQMARALRRVTTEAGVDPAGLALVAYGGAGPLHASALARALGCAAAILPPAPGVLSAAGLLVAPRRQEVSQTVMASPGDDLGDALAALADRVDDALGDREWVADLRYAGQAHELRIPFPDGRPDGLAEAFAAAHTAAYGYAMPDRPIELVTLRLVATGPPLVDGPLEGWDLGAAADVRWTTADLGDGPEDVAVHARGSLTTAGTVVEGPAIITQPDSTALLLRGDVAEVDAHGNLVVRVPPEGGGVRS
ncbi:hydantoinase/oxoprolinase family protein [Euzebya sp.]|uniref:hydantoinase/oxoprolinase family protein n=1 Tax=Euzebya sp. TaxID=1971409 RepID=UPI003510E25C